MQFCTSETTGHILVSRTNLRLLHSKIDVCYATFKEGRVTSVERTLDQVVGLVK